jgi:phage recombination protein Bet
MTTALAAVPNNTMMGFPQEEVDIIKASVLPPDTNLTDLKLFLAQARRTKLDALSRQIYAFKQGQKLVIGTTIDGARVIAERSGKYAGQEGPFWCGADGVWKDVWLDKAPPAAAKVGVVRSDFKGTLWGIARYESYRPPFNSPVWAKMPENMLAKCAEMLALRKAFPNDLSGLYAKEELESQEIQVVEGEGKPLPQAQDASAPRTHKAIPATRRKESSGQSKANNVTVAPPEAGRIDVPSPREATQLEEVTEVEEAVTSPVAGDTAASEPAGATDVALTFVDNTKINKDDIMRYRHAGHSNGYDDSELSAYLAETFNVTPKTILELTKDQLAQATAHFSKKRL